MRSLLVAVAILGANVLSGSAGAAPKAEPGAPAVRTSPVSHSTHCEGGHVTGDRALARYAGCQRIAGDLTVTGASSFVPLNELQEVEGTLRFTKNSASTLELGGLRRVESLVVDSNAGLEDIGALDALTHVSRIDVRDNPRLRSFQGPARLERLDELVITNTRLVTLSGFENLRAVERVTVTSNARLISLRALDGVRRTRRLELVANHRLCACFGLFRGLEQPPTESIIRSRALFPSELRHLEPVRPETIVASSSEK